MNVWDSVEWVPLESSVLTAVAYRASLQQLYLQFQEGNIYRYFACPRSVYNDLVAAESKGRYFAQHIRNGFRCERVREYPAGSRPARDSRLNEALRQTLRVRTLESLRQLRYVRVTRRSL